MIENLSSCLDDEYQIEGEMGVCIHTTNCPCIINSSLKFVLNHLISGKKWCYKKALEEI